MVGDPEDESIPELTGVAPPEEHEDNKMNAEDYREARMLLEGKVQKQNMRPMDVMALPETIDKIQSEKTFPVEGIYWEKIQLVPSQKCEPDTLVTDDGEEINVGQ